MTVARRPVDTATGSDQHGTLMLACEACGSSVRIYLNAGTTKVTDGPCGTVTYGDKTLVVWDCPACHYTHAEDLTT